MRPPLVCVIVTYNSRGHVGRAIESVLGHQPEIPICVVDEASGDGTAQWVAETYPQVRVIPEEANLGFGAGMNRAFRDMPADQYLLLNPDAEFLDGAIETLRSTMATEEGLGGVSPLVRRSDADGRIDSLGIGLGEDLAPVSVFCGQPATTAPLARGEVFGFHGAAALVSRAMIESVGGFDPLFFLYQEEFDLCWRARRAGWRFLAEPRAEVRHQVGASGSGSAWREYHLERNRIWCLVKNAEWPDLRRSWAALCRAEWSAWRYGLFGPARWVLRARRDALLGLGRIWRGRRVFESRHPNLQPVGQAWRGRDLM